MNYLKSAISFKSEDHNCAGRLYIPLTASAIHPCVVMANGFSGTMDWILPGFADAFSSNGFAVLIFDYRHLGESEGEPRQLIDPERQLTDLRNAIRFARQHNKIDPNKIALWGTSLGGSYILSLAAEDESFAAVIGNMPAIDAVKGANVKAKMKKTGATNLDLVSTSLRLLAVAAYDNLRGILSLSPSYIKVYGEPGKAFFTDPALASRFEFVAKNSPTWQNKVAARFLFKAPRYREGTFEKIRAPIMLTLATDDVEVSTSFIKRKAKNAASVKIMEYPYGHFDLYHGEVFKTVVADQISFLRKYLG